MVEVEEIPFLGWDECLRISNDVLELVATLEVGPRIIHFGFSEKENVFSVDQEQAGTVGGNDWKTYGGHRLWHAPEHEERSYLPDNDPVEYEKREGGAVLVQPTENETSIQKEMEIEMHPSEPEVEIYHRLKNEGLWEVELAPWAISVMSAGGKAIIPITRGDTDALLPDRSIVLWPYTELNDERLQLNSECIFLNQDEETEDPIKIGASVKDGWTAYHNGDYLFAKSFDFDEVADYPDRGCSVECYTNDFMLELETLGPMQRIEPGETVEYLETWRLFEDVPEPADGEDVKNDILRLVEGNW